MKADILLGLQWGDEGKGKIVDLLAGRYDVVARFQGGPNAGHSLEFEGKKFVLHSIPSGIFHEGTQNLIGNGMVIDPVVFKNEVEGLEKAGYDLHSNVFIGRKAHLILPSHRILDAASEAAKGKTKIGSTLKGIGPTYMDKTGRNGLRVGDIEAEDFAARYEKLTEKHKNLLRLYDYSYSIEESQEEWFEGIKKMQEFQFVDAEFFVNNALDNEKSVLAEGAQGTLLDIDYGSYPFVTSSNTIGAGALTGLGIAPGRIGKVMGIFKAYCTRVGSGPFPTELFGTDGKSLQNAGNEFGATTGRPRRCGWLDLVALKYAVMINGVTDLIITKADVLKALKDIYIATAYKIGETQTAAFPFELTGVEPVLERFDSWQEDISSVRDMAQLPKAFTDYIRYIEEDTGVKVSIVSVGPDRAETIWRK